VLAKLALEGSYACRRAASRAVELPALGQVIARTEATMLRRGAGDEDPRTVVRTCAEMLKQPAGAEGAPSPVERFYLYLRIAVSWDRLGDSELALEALEQAKAALQPAGEPAALKPLLDIADQRRELITRGKEFRAVAVTAMRRAFVEQNAYPAGAVVPTAYLLGELYRRQGDCARAGAWLTLSAKVAGAGHPLSRTVAETMQLPSMKNAGVDVEEEAVAVALLAKLTGRKPEEFLGPPDEGDGGGTGVVPAAAPLTCSEALETLGAAVRAYAGKHRRAPTSLEELLTGGFIGEKAAAGFKCPECGVELRYRQPKDLDDAEAVMIWHPAGGKCRQLIMYADGKVREKK
jgi:tetratricopeptide (TPR) repeat protein